MGVFLKQFSSEFGKKSGKALGNALYGSYGEDKRIGIRIGDNTSINSIAKPERPRSDNSQSIKNISPVATEAEIVSIEFDYEDEKQIITKLSLLSSIMDTLLSKNSREIEGIRAATESKFKLGLTLLRTNFPSNPMIDYFDSQVTEWDNQKAKSKHADTVGLIIGLSLIFVPAIIALIMSRIS